MLRFLTLRLVTPLTKTSFNPILFSQFPLIENRSSFATASKPKEKNTKPMKSVATKKSSSNKNKVGVVASPNKNKVGVVASSNKNKGGVVAQPTKQSNIAKPTKKSNLPKSTKQTAPKKKIVKKSCFISQIKDY